MKHKGSEQGTKPKTIEMSVVLKKTKIQKYLGLEQLKYILEAALKLLFNHPNTTT